MRHASEGGPHADGGAGEDASVGPRAAHSGAAQGGADAGSRARARSGSVDRQARYRRRLATEFGKFILPVDARTVWCAICNKTLSLGDEYGISNARVHFRRIHSSGKGITAPRSGRSPKRAREESESDGEAGGRGPGTQQAGLQSLRMYTAHLHLDAGAVRAPFAGATPFHHYEHPSQRPVPTSRRGRRPKGLDQRAHAFKIRLRKMFGPQFKYLSPRAVVCNLCPRKLALSGDFRLSNLRVHNRHKHREQVPKEGTFDDEEGGSTATKDATQTTPSGAGVASGSTAPASSPTSASAKPGLGSSNSADSPAAKSRPLPKATGGGADTTTAQ